MITYNNVTNLNNIDYDRLFQSSYPLIDNNFVWPIFVSTFEQKKQYYYEQLVQAVDGSWAIKSSEDRLLMYVVELDGIQVEFSCGFIEQDRCFRPHWFLTAPDNNGSRNWLYTADNRNAKSAFYQSLNITSYKVSTYIGSDLYKLFKMREATGNFQIISEQPTVPGSNPLRLVTLRIAT